MWAAMINATTAARSKKVGLTDEERRANLIYKNRAYDNYKAFAQALLEDCSGKGHAELHNYYLLKYVKSSLLAAISENLKEFQGLLGDNLENSALYYLLSSRRETLGKNINSSSLRQLRVCIDVLKEEKNLNDLPNPLEGELVLRQCLEFILRYERADQDAKDPHKDRYEQALLMLITSVKSVEQKASFFLKLDPGSDRYSEAKSVIKACFMSRKLNNQVFDAIIKELTHHEKKTEIIRLLAAADRKTYLKRYLSGKGSLGASFVASDGLFSSKLNKLIAPIELSEVKNPNPNPNPN